MLEPRTSREWHWLVIEVMTATYCLFMVLAILTANGVGL